MDCGGDGPENLAEDAGHRIHSETQKPPRNRHLTVIQPPPNLPLATNHHLRTTLPTTSFSDLSRVDLVLVSPQAEFKPPMLYFEVFEDWREKGCLLSLATFHWDLTSMKFLA